MVRSGPVAAAKLRIHPSATVRTKAEASITKQGDRFLKIIPSDAKTPESRSLPGFSWEPEIDLEAVNDFSAGVVRWCRFPVGWIILTIVRVLTQRSTR